jgi:hypothetical protein
MRSTTMGDRDRDGETETRRRVCVCARERAIEGERAGLGIAHTYYRGVRDIERERERGEGASDIPR